MRHSASHANLRRFVAVAGFGLLGACSQSEVPDDAPPQAPPIVRVSTAEQALQGANLPTVDPSTMNDAEIRKIIGSRAYCAFRYTSTGKPVAVVGLDQGGRLELGVLKLDGSLVTLAPDPDAASRRTGDFALAAGPVRLGIHADPQELSSARQAAGQVEADMRFEIGEELDVGYRGYLECVKTAPAPAGGDVQ